MARSGRVAVCQFVKQQKTAGILCPPTQRGIKVEFLQGALTVIDILQRQAGQVLKHLRGFAAAVGFNQTDDQPDALFACHLRGSEHRVGFAHAGRSTKKQLQLAASGFLRFLLNLCQQGIGIGAVVSGRDFHDVWRIE